MRGRRFKRVTVMLFCLFCGLLLDSFLSFAYQNYDYLLIR